MNHGSLRGLGCVLAITGLLFSSIASAALTPVMPGQGAEPDLATQGGILDRWFGLQNLSRVDDNLDQYWVNNGRVNVKTMGKWAGLTHSFGFFDSNGDFTSLFDVGRGSQKPAAHFGNTDSGSLFRFGLSAGNTLWSSAPADNSDLLDHMVTWKITSSHNRNLVGAFVLAWEDLRGDSDRDFNDLVLLIKGDVDTQGFPGQAQSAVVPVPAALWLFGSGLLGLAATARRYNR